MCTAFRFERSAWTWVKKKNIIFLVVLSSVYWKYFYVSAVFICGCFCKTWVISHIYLLFVYLYNSALAHCFLPFFFSFCRLQMADAGLEMQKGRQSCLVTLIGMNWSLSVLSFTCHCLLWTGRVGPDVGVCSAMKGECHWGWGRSLSWSYLLLAASYTAIVSEPVTAQ